MVKKNLCFLILLLMEQKMLILLQHKRLLVQTILNFTLLETVEL